MREYKLRDILQYAKCPFKYKLHLENNSQYLYDLDSRSIITSALAETYLQACHYISQGKPFSTQQRAKYFSRSWNKLNDMFISKGGKANRVHAHLLSAHNSVLNMDKPISSSKDVAVVSFPTELIIKNYLITDKLDLVLVDKKNTHNIELVFIDYSNSEKRHIDLDTNIRAMFNLLYFKKELTGTPNLNISCTIFNLHHNYHKKITISKTKLTNYKAFIVDIIRGIEADIYYPRATNSECQECFFKYTCQFSQV
jgi:CRISPR/Cas system-associated exonuclease Cas4 (RecB family)